MNCTLRVKCDLGPRQDVHELRPESRLWSERDRGTVHQE